MQGPATAVKVVSVPKPSCSIPGLPATTLLFDEASGLTRACVNAADLTGIRTACAPSSSSGALKSVTDAPLAPYSAASALATKLLANPSSTSLAVFGSGTQAYYHARASHSLSLSVPTPY